MGEVRLDGLAEFDDSSINHTTAELPPRSRTRPLLVVSAHPYPLGCVLPRAHWLWTLMVEGVVLRARTQLKYQKAKERAYKGIAPPNPTVAGGIPTTWHMYVPHIFAPLRVHLWPTKLILGLFRSRTPPPRTAPAPQCRSPWYNRDRIPLWPVGATHFSRAGGRACKFLRDAPEPSRLPHRNHRDSHGFDMPWPRTPAGHRSTVWAGSPPVLSFEGSP